MGSVKRKVGADPRVCPTPLGEHTGSPLHPLSSFPRRRESRGTGTHLPCWMDSRLRGNDENDMPSPTTEVLEDEHGVGSLDGQCTFTLSQILNRKNADAAATTVRILAGT